MYYPIFNVFIILLSWPLPASSQTPLDSAISQLNPCANSCISKFAPSVNCGPTDFACQCSHLDAVIGSGKPFSPSPAGGCLIKDCGFSNSTEVRNSFKKICDLEAASAAISSELPASPSNPNPTPAAPSSPTTAVTSPENTPAAPTPTPQPAPTTVATPTTIPTFPPNTPSPATAAPVTTSSASQSPVPSIPQSTQAGLPSPITSSTNNSPANSLTSIPTTPIADNTPTAQTPQSSSTSPSFTITLTSSPPSIFPIPSIITPSPQNTPITESNPSLQTTTPPTVSRKRLSPGVIFGIVFLVLGFIFTLISIIVIHLRRRKRRSYISDEKLRPVTPLTRDGVFSSLSNSVSASRWLPWDAGRGKNKISTVMGIDIGSQSQSPSRSNPTSSPTDPFCRPKSRGRQNTGSSNEAPPSSFSVLQRGVPQGVNTGSPPSTGRPGTSSSGNGQPLKSAMKKPRDRPKSRPLILRDGESGAFSFGLDPLGSHPRSPR